MAKTEEQIMLERLGILEDTSTNDSDFEGDSPVADELQEERERLDSWQLQLEEMEQRVREREDEVNALLRQNNTEKKRLNRWEAELHALEAKLEEKWSKSDDGEPQAAVMDDGAIDEYRKKKKKANRLIKKRDAALDVDPEMVRSVWSTNGWNTNT